METSAHPTLFSAVSDLATFFSDGNWKHGGFKRKLQRGIRYLRDPVYNRRIIELNRDLRHTRREVAGWGVHVNCIAKRKGIVAIQCFSGLPVVVKTICLLGKVVQLHDYDPLIVTTLHDVPANRYFDLFGLRRIQSWYELTGRYGLPLSELQKLVRDLMPSDLTVTAARQIRFHEIQVGMHALSVTCRRRVEGNLALDDLRTRETFTRYLQEAVQSVVVAEKFFDTVPVRRVLSRDVGYIPTGAIFEVGLRRGLDSIVFDPGQRRSTWIFKRYQPGNLGLNCFSVSKKTLNKLKQQPWSDALNARVEREFADRYQPDSTEDRRRLQSGKVIKSPDEVRGQLKLDPQKKTAVIFSHVAWDGAFFFGSCLFEDFEDWLFQTVRFVAQECPHLNWIVKLHPVNVFKSIIERRRGDEPSEMRLLRPLMPLPPHVRLMPAETNINTRSLFPLIDYVVTVSGTVGLELPCFGVPAVLAGTGRYDGLGFTLEPGSRDDYFTLLRNLQQVPRLDAAQQELARRHFHALIVRRQTSFEDVAPMELKKLHESDTDVHDNISFTPRSLAQFTTAPSIVRIGQWLMESDEPDILEPLRPETIE